MYMHIYVCISIHSLLSGNMVILFLWFLYCKVVRKIEKYRQMLCPTCTYNMSLFTPCSAVPPPIDGFTASPTSTSIAVLWKEPTATIDYYKVSGRLENYYYSLLYSMLHCLYLQLTIHSVEANTTEHSDLFRTVTSHTFHNLSSSTAYSVTITAVNKGKSGPPVSLDVTTRGTPGNS